jgi:hypothetical protein
MTSSLFAILCFAATPWFSPNVRIHQERRSHGSFDPAIAVGRGTPSQQPIYVAYEDDSMAGFVPVNGSLMFQKSTDAGATWLAEDKLVRYIGYTNLSPDVTTDPDGNIYIVYTGRDTSAYWGHYYCVRSTDGGVTWGEPAQIDDYATEVRDVQWARIASDSAGNLFCAWTDRRDKRYIWSSVSTDRGMTWRANIRVDNDTTHPRGGFTDVDVFVEPSTNQYLVAARWFYYTLLSGETGYQYEIHVYRSTDGGLTFQSSARLDTFSYFVGNPQVVADGDYIVCDYTGNPGDRDGQCLTESRTFYTGPDTWGSIAAMNDTVFSTYYYGAKLAVSADGIVHTALMCRGSSYWMGYAYSVDHGASWSGVTRVNDGGVDTQYPDIGVDLEGYAYVVWCDLRSGLNEIWFSTNSPAAIAEEASNSELRTPNRSPTVARGVLFLPVSTSPMPQAASSLLDIGGRQVMVLKPGANDVRGLSPGIYFVREAQSQTQAIRKVVVAR